MRLATIAYIPRKDIPAKVCSPTAFVENLRKFKTRYELVLYTDGKDDFTKEFPDIITIPNPELYINKDAKLKNGWPNTFALNNLIFFTGLRIAHKRKISHFLYLEADCRVGCDLWDEKLFDFHFRHPEPLVCSGTAVAFNVCSDGRAAHGRWWDWVRQQKTAPGIPACSTFGWGGQSYKTEKPTVFVNGALGVYDATWLFKLFPDALKDTPQPSNAPVEQVTWAQRLSAAPLAETSTEQKSGGSIQLAESSFAWDFAIGFELWKALGLHSFDVVANNPLIYSGFGDSYTSEEFRMEMLRKGDIICTHQVKSSATI